MRRTIGCLLALVAVVPAGCSGDDDAEDAAPESTAAITSTTQPATTTTVSTTVPTFAGDPDSPFCRLVAEGDERPVLDPFESDLDAREVELRLRNLRNRFEEFAEVAPPGLEADLDALVVALADTDTSLAAHDYDFDSMAEAGVTVSTFDDPVFEVVGFRLSEYRAQVCERR